MSPRILVALIAGLLVLAGCGDDPKPRISSDPTPVVTSRSTVPTTSPPTTASPLPLDGEEFIRQWSAAETDMQNTGQTTAYREITQGCTPCTKSADQIDGIYAAGGFVRYAGQAITKLKRLESEDITPVYLATVSAGKTDYKESADGETRHLDGGVVTYKVYLTHIEGRWLVANFTRYLS